MSKITVFTDIMDTHLLLSRYVNGDEAVDHAIVCDNLPKAKVALKEYLEQLLKEVDELKLKDIQ